jgi:hypothetical protein
MICPINKKECEICAEYSKEGLCDFPYRNCNKEIKAIRLWGHRMPTIKYPQNYQGSMDDLKW